MEQARETMECLPGLHACCNCSASLRQKAAKIFGRLKMKAIEMNVHDPSLPIKIQEAQRESEGSSSRITKEIVEQAAMGGDLQFQ